MDTVLLALGQEGGASGAPTGCGGGLQMLPLALMFVVMYFLLIRPQQKKAKEHQGMVNALQKGDMVITRGGVIGKISGIQDNVLTLEVQEKVRIRVLRSYVEGRYQEQSGKTPAASKSAEPAPQPELKN